MNTVDGVSRCRGNQGILNLSTARADTKEAEGMYIGGGLLVLILIIILLVLIF